MDVSIWYFPGMEIDLTRFSLAQRKAFLDLIILAMYADGHLSLVEEEHLQKLLVAMGFLDEIDGAVTRIRPSIQSIQKAKERALKLADAFTTRPQQVKVYAAVEELMTSDNNVSSWENTLLMELRLKFRL